MDRYIKKNGVLIPRLGCGTWYMGENAGIASQEIKSIQTSIENGVTLIDTAEMYGNGKAETLLGKAVGQFIAEKAVTREQLYVVSKVYPHNAGGSKIFQACDNTLKRLGMDYLDLYLLHWRGSIPLSETVRCMEELKAEGKIKNWGVSNFDTEDMEELFSVENGDKCSVNQVLYHIGSRGVEYDLIPWLDEHDVPMMAYCPLAQGGTLKKNLYGSSTLRKIAQAHDCSIQNVMLAFVLRHSMTIAIPKASNPEHALDNAKAWECELTPRELDMINKEFPAPTYKTYLDIV